MSNRIGACAECRQQRRLIGRGLCSPCYQRASKVGTLQDYSLVRPPFRQTLTAARSTATTDGCWPWPSVTSNGYPTMVKSLGRHVHAHVASYQAVNGPVPRGMTIDHACHSTSQDCRGGTACRHRRCVNPAHLEAVTASEQQWRRPDRRDNRCGNGHAWTVDNIRWARDGKGYTYRACKACARDTARRSRLRRQPPREERSA